MRIIKNGHTTTKTVCPSCKSILEVSTTDLKGGDVVPYHYTCPVCDKNNYIRLKEMPKAFVDNLPDDTGA